MTDGTDQQLVFCSPENLALNYNKTNKELLKMKTTFLRLTLVQVTGFYYRERARVRLIGGAVENGNRRYI